MTKLRKNFSRNLFKTKKIAANKKIVGNFRKEQDKKIILTGIVQVASSSTIFGMILGSIISFFYLNAIGFHSIFAEIINQLSSLTAVTFVFGLFILLVFISFAAPCFIFNFWDDFKEATLVSNFIKSRWLKAPLLFWSLICPLFFYILFIILIQTSESFPKDCLTILLYGTMALSVVVPLWFWKKFISKSFWREWKSWLPFTLYLFIISAFMSIYPLLIFVLLASLMPEGEFQFFYLYLVGALLILNLFGVTNFVTTYTKAQKHKYFMIPIGCTLFLFAFPSSFFPFYNNFSAYILNTVRFVELPQNASWYLLHNNFQKNDGSQESSGIDPKDLQSLKQVFKQPNICARAEYRNNALYGYMAWNLGKAKVFCPAIVSNITKKENEQKKLSELSEKCLVIDTQFLQPIPKNYIGID